ncbi:uracil phosphoribosyltransferase [Rothia dentocariosa]|uniref:uracil phosphoribosyltransferase n=1 Tax=Rothia dentocariosa TaxID=2047 RepID=UPI0028EB05CF|nr:uracil phosphoribosyltransferase [Rothia dentocariosa]
MSTDKNFSTADNNDPQPSTEESGISDNNPENARQEPKYTQLYGLEGTDGKISLESQASPKPQDAEKEPSQHKPTQFDIDPKTHKSLLIAQAIRNVLIIIPTLVMLVILVYGVTSILTSAHSEYNDLAWFIIFITTIFALPNIIHIILQIFAFMRFRKSVRFQWIRGVNIYSLIVAPISEVIYVPFILDWVIIPFMGYHVSGSKQISTAIGSMVSLYEIILCILMIVVMTNSIKKTAQLSGQKH